MTGLWLIARVGLAHLLVDVGLIKAAKRVVPETRR